MAIPALPRGMTHWEELVRQEASTGEIPLPTVDSIVFDGGEPAMSLIAKDLVPGGSHLFVDLGRMPPADRITLASLLALLAYESGFPPEKLTAVHHSGGLAYEFVGSQYGWTAQWADISETARPVLWSILHAIAELGARYPDWEASTPRPVHVNREADAGVELELLAALLRSRNVVDEQIATVIGRPAQPGHLGEYIAARIFDIELNASASARGYDGVFRSGPLADQSVNVKWYPKHERLLDIKPDPSTRYYMVLTGSYSPPGSSRGALRPLYITAVYLFDIQQLVAEQVARGVATGTAASVTKGQWERAQIYPEMRNAILMPSEEQRRLLALFAPPD